MLIRLLSLLAVLFAGFSAPVLAASSDVTLLQSYVGNYVGRSTVVDPRSNRPQPVTCRLVLAGGGDKVTYTGRCSFGAGSMSMTGVFAVVGGKFQAAMTSSGMSGTATGVRHGNSISFTSKGHTTMGGVPRSVSSTLTLTGGSIKIDFVTTDDKTGKTTRGSIPFVKA
jgi:hypothetical protein